MTGWNPGFNDGAWDIPGFTAQNPVYPAAATTTAPNVPYGTVTAGKGFFSPSGQAANGFVTMTPSVRQYTYNDSIIELDPIKVKIQQGQVNFNVPTPTPTGSPVSNPTAWTWDIRIRVGPTTTDYPAVSIATGQTLDITTLGP